MPATSALPAPATVETVEVRGNQAVVVYNDRPIGSQITRLRQAARERFPGIRIESTDSDNVVAMTAPVATPQEIRNWAQEHLLPSKG